MGGSNPPVPGTTVFEFEKAQTFLLCKDGQEVPGTWVILDDGGIEATLPTVFGPQIISGRLEKAKLFLEIGGGKTLTLLKAEKVSSLKFGGADLM